MSFSELYDFRQSLELKIGRNTIRDKVVELSRRGKIRTMKTGLDTTICRGFYLSANNVDHPFVKQHGTTIIVLARGLNVCFERFVYIKKDLFILRK